MEMEKKLYEATLQGNVPKLQALIQQDPLILDRIKPTYFFQTTPLHLSTLHGHLHFSRALLSHNPRLATESDSLGQLPLHVASAHGHVEIVRELIQVDPRSCLDRTKEGRLPLHLAIMGRASVEVVRELARTSPESTRVRDDKGDGVLHMCVEYDNLEGFKVLVEILRGEIDDGGSLLNAKNDDGNTAFHLAVLYKNLEITKLMLATAGVELDAVNKNGLTALDLLENTPKDLKTLELLNLLLQSNIQKPTKNNHHSSLSPPKSPSQPSKNHPWKNFFTFNDNNINHLQNMKGELLIIAAIIAAVHALPTIYLRINQPDLLDIYSINSGSFVPSVALIVVLLGGFPLSNKLCAWLVIQLMYSTIGFFGLGYIGAMISFESRYSKMDVAIALMFSWFVLLMILSAINVIRLIVLIVKSIKERMKQRRM